MFVIEYLNDLGNPKLTCSSSLSDAKATCNKRFENGYPSKIYLVREVDDARRAIAAVELGFAEVIYEAAEPPTAGAVEKAARESLLREIEDLGI